MSLRRVFWFLLSFIVSSWATFDIPLFSISLYLVSHLPSIPRFSHQHPLNIRAEFVNSFNNSVSGIIYVKARRDLEPGAACMVNGFVGQLSVQAADFSVLAIAVMTLLTVTRMAYMPNSSQTKRVGICAAVWIVPFITSITATAMGEMKPVGGNWCWISKDRSDLRYGLAHGWRFATIFLTMAIYVYVWFYLRRAFGGDNQESWSYGSSEASQQASSCFSGIRRDSGFKMMKDRDMEMVDLEGPKPVAVDTKDDEIHQKRASVQFQTIEGRHRRKPSVSMKDLEVSTPAPAYPGPSRTKDTDLSKHTNGATLQTNASEFPIRRETHHVEREIRRMLLLNAYPFMYVALWIPGLVNRLLEASGHPPSAEVGAALQVSTQFVGLANALTYGFNHHLRDRLKSMYFTNVLPRLKRRGTR